MSVTSRRPAPSWPRRRSKTATCCYPTRQASDDGHRRRSRASQNGRRRPAALYASFPATAGTRTLAQLTGLAGAIPASLVLIGAAAAAAERFGAIGAPSFAMLAGGLLLVVACGAAGIAIGTRFAHPIAGMLGALALLLSSGTTHLASGGGIWLVPWQGVQNDLGSLPGPLAGYPPAGAHAVELAAIAIVSGVVALAVTVGRSRIMVHTILPHTHPPAVYPLIAQFAGWCAVAVAAAACADRSRYADLGGAVAAPAAFAAIAVAWYLPVTVKILVAPPATARGVTIAWYSIASAALAMTCAAMRDQWHRYSRLRRFPPHPEMAGRTSSRCASG